MSMMVGSMTPEGSCRPSGAAASDLRGRHDGSEGPGDHGVRRIALVLLALTTPTAAQAFEVDNSAIPFNGGSTENLDFGDVDLDGDWDVVLAKVYDRLWINMGGAARRHARRLPRRVVPAAAPRPQ